MNYTLVVYADRTFPKENIRNNNREEKGIKLLVLLTALETRF
jgi:hypothetical protein